MCWQAGCSGQTMPTDPLYLGASTGSVPPDLGLLPVAKASLAAVTLTFKYHSSVNPINEVGRITSNRPNFWSGKV